MKPKWQKLAYKSGPGNMHTLVSVLWCGLCFQRIPFYDHNWYESDQLKTKPQIRVCNRIFFISQPKHMLWVLRRTINEMVLLSTQTHMFKLMGKKNHYNLCYFFCLS